MSRQLVSHSPDLQRLEDEGYALSIREEPLHLLVRVPYVNPRREVAAGILVSELSLSGQAATPPSTHVVYFIGETEGELPCDQNGNPLNELINQNGNIDLGGGLVASCSFSHKPDPTYPNYYEKMSTYCDMVVAYAQQVDPDVTAKTFPPVETAEGESVFRYLDAATSRAGIGSAADKLRRMGKVVIAGVGGTGSYILDLIAKTPVGEIHLYDSDFFETHNAFRAPGAAALDELDARPRKVDYFKDEYDAMRRGIVAHPCDVDETNVEELRDADFVFVSIEGNEGKRFLLQKLQEFGVPFIDVGLGVYQTGDSLGGVVRTTTCTPTDGDHIWEQLTFADGDEIDEYEKNIQLADLNMFNASLAVIRWKRLVGFYFDFEHELTSIYTIDGNHMLNEDHTGEARGLDEDEEEEEEAA